MNDNPDISAAYCEAREHEHPIFANAPFVELGPVGREWSMITLVDLQTAVFMSPVSRSETQNP